MLFNKEPAVIIGGMAEIIRSVIPMMIIFGLIQWTDDQLAQVMLVIGVTVGVAEKWFTRSQVVPNEMANKQIEIAKFADPSTSNQDIIDKAAK